MFIILLAALICIAIMYILKLNRRQEVDFLIYQNKFINPSLAKYVLIYG
ncbi:ORF_44 [Adoxophyes orana granulovirus]|uniref:ADOR44 n=1 Tax=Adoxophyes orana granulovirus TaxID=170617 RepID=Q7T9X1_GVAO|nr:ORF_44 [Adoxophyes orana granulovirus]AAP85681.1 ORF_44 [Adoxophyes orana granulovirus]AJA91684.1 ADOR44 [Adoxophyes orana granulovirus]